MLTLAICLLGALRLAAAAAWPPGPASTRYVVNACLAVSAQGPAKIGLGWRAPRASSVIRMRPYRTFRRHRNALCGAIPWAALLPREGVIVVPLGGIQAGGRTDPAEPQG